MIQDVGKLAIEMTQEMEKVLKKRYKDVEELRDLVRKALPKTLSETTEKIPSKVRTLEDIVKKEMESGTHLCKTLLPIPGKLQDSMKQLQEIIKKYA